MQSPRNPSHDGLPVAILLLTGYEQARSVAAAIAGDWEAARDVQLVLPKTGVCSGPIAAGGVASSCCGPAAPVAPSASTLIALTPVAAAVSNCCATEVQATCCEPAAKADCCGTPTSAASSKAIPLLALQSTGERSCGCQ